MTYKIRQRKWKVTYTVFPNSKYANSGMEKYVEARDIESAYKKSKNKAIRIDAIEHGI